MLALIAKIGEEMNAKYCVVGLGDCYIAKSPKEGQITLLSSDKPFLYHNLMLA
jgi:hypothetical protein